jgi:hypothetical protein
MMALFDWLRRLVARPSASAPLAPLSPAPAPLPEPAIEPDTGWRLLGEGDAIVVLDPDANRRAVAISSLTAIAIEVTDDGEGSAEPWWVFYGPDEDVVFAAPMGAAGEQAMVDRIATLPGYRADLQAAAAESQDIDTFVVWQRPLD